MCRKIAFFWVRAEILLSRDKVSLDSHAGPFLGFVNKYWFLEKYTPLPAPALSPSWSSYWAPASTWRSWWLGWRLTLPTPPSSRSSPPTGFRWRISWKVLMCTPCPAPGTPGDQAEQAADAAHHQLLACPVRQSPHCCRRRWLAGCYQVILVFLKTETFFKHSWTLKIKNHREELEELKEHMRIANIDILFDWFLPWIKIHANWDGKHYSTKQCGMIDHHVHIDLWLTKNRFIKNH